MDTTVKVNKAAMTRRWLNSAIKAADANGNQPPWWRGRDGAAWRKSAGQRARQA